MITTSAPAFYLIKTTGEAAELLSSLISPKTMLDIKTAIVVSTEFNNDIEPIHELDSAISTLREGLHSTELEQSEEFNPLYYPSSDERIDDVLEVELKSDRVSFNAMNGNPYHAKRIEIKAGEETTLEAAVIFQQFDLPGYETIMEGRQRPLN